MTSNTRARSGAYGTMVAVVVMGALGGRPATAQATTVNTCLAGKLGDVGGSVMARAACHGKNAARPDTATLAACLERAARRFDGGNEPALGRFAKRERRPPCLTNGDQAAQASAIASYVAELDAGIGNGGAANQCDAAAFACVGRYVAGVTACLARAAKGTGVIDVRCLGKQRERLADPGRGCLRKAALRGPCSTPLDPTALAAAADGFAADTLCALDPSGAAACAALPTPVATPTRTPTPIATRTPTPVATPSDDDVEQFCVDRINAYRASIGRPPYARWTAAETCADAQSLSDGQSHVPHGAFGQCSERAQNECPGWSGPPQSMIGNCLQVMWNEGPGSDFPTHGHYINMASTQYTKVACGFAVMPNGSVWAVQDFQ